MGIVIRFFSLARDTAMTIANIVTGLDSWKKLDFKITFMLLCIIGLAVYFSPLVAIVILLFASYDVVQMMINKGETEDETNNRYIIGDSWSGE